MHTVLQVHRPGEGGPMQSSCWHPNGGQAMEGHTARELATVYPPCCPPSPQPTCATTGQCRGALITQGGQTWQGDTPAVASVADRPPGTRRLCGTARAVCLRLAHLHSFTFPHPFIAQCLWGPSLQRTLRFGGQTVHRS